MFVLRGVALALAAALTVTVASGLSGCASSPAEPLKSEDSLVGDVASLNDSPSAIAVDGSNVYWAVGQGSDAGIYRRDKLGVAPGKKLCATLESTSALAVDATHLYWVVGDGSVFSVAKGGGAPTLLGAVSGHRITSLAVDEGAGPVAPRLFVATSDALWRVDKAGGPLTRLGEGTFLSMTSDRNTLYFVRQTGAQGAYRLFAMPKAGQYPRDEVPLIAETTQQPLGLTVDATRVHWTSFDSALERQRVLAVSKTGGTIQTLGETPLSGATYGALDGDVVCFADKIAVTCQKTGGGGAAKVARAVDLRGLAVAGDYVFWTEQATTRDRDPFDMMPSDIPGSGSVHRAKLPWLP